MHGLTITYLGSILNHQQYVISFTSSYNVHFVFYSSISIKKVIRKAYIIVFILKLGMRN